MSVSMVRYAIRTAPKLPRVRGVSVSGFCLVYPLFCGILGEKNEHQKLRRTQSEHEWCAAAELQSAKRARGKLAARPFCALQILLFGGCASPPRARG